MTLRLILTRHAKSSWDDPVVDDHDRVLNARGVASAKAIGGWLAQKGYCPGAVLCSTAQRTRETWVGIASSCGADADVNYVQALYLASPDQMLSILKGGKGGCVMLLAHNPGSAMLASALVKAAPNHAGFSRYPTAATTVIDFEADRWADIALHKGTVVDFIVPRELAT